jgi:hypothetical protein
MEITEGDSFKCIPFRIYQVINVFCLNNVLINHIILLKLLNYLIELKSIMLFWPF